MLCEPGFITQRPWAGAGCESNCNASLKTLTESAGGGEADIDCLHSSPGQML